jgi:hypothetical protein
MDRTAGYAATLGIRQELLQFFVRVFYNAGRLPPSLVADVPTVSATLFLSLPEFTLRASNDDRVQIDLYAWGPLTITPPGGSPEFRRVKFRARVLVPLVVGVSGGGLTLGFAAALAEAQNVQFDPYAGGSFSPAAVTYILSDEFQSLITFGIRLKLGDLSSLLPPLRLDFLGALASEASLVAESAILDGALAIGFDIDIAGLRTQGDRSRLTDVTDGDDLGAWTNPRAIEVAFPDVRARVETDVAAQDATLDDFSMRVEEGWFHVAGRASATGGSVDFSLHAVPKLYRPGVHSGYDEEYGEHVDTSTPPRDELWFDPQDVDVDVDRDWWVIFLEIITGGIAALVVESIVASMRNSVTLQIGEDGEGRTDRYQAFTLPGVSRPSMRLSIQRFECHVEGVFMSLRIRGDFWSGGATGPARITAEESLTATLRYQALLPADALAEDPELRCRWTVRRSDTNEILLSRDRPARVNLELLLGIAQIPFLELEEITIEARVYRTLGAGSEELVNKLLTLRVEDYVDRHHPYVRWTHDLMLPVVRVEADGSHTIDGYSLATRHSAIHRTALPGRCRMLVHISGFKLEPEGALAYPYDYLDTLPFPEAELIPRRAVVCDYCFFGGPDKTVPLI